MEATANSGTHAPTNALLLILRLDFLDNPGRIYVAIMPL
jgi:hypothetical protein